MGVRAIITAGLALLVSSAVFVAASAAQRTTKDGVFLKDQAERATEKFAKLCAHCHDPAKVVDKQKAGPALTGDVFFENWQDRTLGELMTTIRLTMPNDGSAVLTVDDAIDLTAYILQWNKFPEGKEPLKNDDAGKKTVISR
jgi:cytochrome c553